MPDTPHTNIDPDEIAKFDAFAKTWWDPDGDMKPLHQLNPLRLDYVMQHATLSQRNALDIGCGGGLLSEAMTQQGAHVTGIDMSSEAIQVAKQHAQNQNLSIDYQQTTVEDFAERHVHHFDVITCMEMLEHVPDPAAIVAACARACKPGGKLFFSTINRNIKSFLGAIVGAEYILRLLPRGTHEYEKFIRPSELTEWCEAVGLDFLHLQGLSYNPLRSEFRLTKDVDINYLICFQSTQTEAT